MLIINQETIQKLTDPVELTSVIIDSMKAYARGDYHMPDRMHVDINGNTLLLMPASSGAYFGTKLVSLFPDNPMEGLPVLFGAVLLNDAKTGQPLALFNGARLTAVRTAAVGSAGIRYTVQENAETLGLIGTGVQGLYQVWFACQTRHFSKVYLYDAIDCRIQPFIEQLQALLPGVSFEQVSNTTELTRMSQVIITATNAEQPVLPDDSDLLTGKHIIAIGSYKENMVELPPAVYPLLRHIYIDVDVACEESGDLIRPLKKQWIRKEQISLLSDLFELEPEELPRQETTVYKSVGGALFDLFTARYLYHKAIQKSMGIKVEF